MEKLKEIYGKFMNIKGLAVILIIGVLLLLMSDSSLSAKKSSDNKKITVSSYNVSEYGKTLEQRLAKMLSEISGASDVSVMITFSDYGKTVYSEEAQSEKGGDSKKDTAKPALKNDSGGGESPVIIKTELPAVSGVLITAKGAENPAVSEKLSSAAMALLNVRSNKVRVLPK